MKGKAGKSECVKVAIRVRPMNKHEIEENSKLCVEVDKVNNTVSVFNSRGNPKTFQFDYVFPMDASQREIYDTVAFPIVDSIFQGYNGTVFAYGQTGCGKTFTMMGIIDNPDLKGIIPNAFSHIFGFIKTEGESKKFLVRCSFVEIYNEEVRDLLVSKSKKLDIREDPKKGIFVKELTYVTLQDTQDIQKCLDNGNKNRHVGHTSMNDQSSRSHSIFTVYLEIEENGKIRSGKLNLVDLAGSERVGKTNATGQTFDEGKKINLSLTALGGVIDALSSNRKHIPYKDSKLTRLLADSLGGNTKTVMFANISPASYNYEETYGTLRYASRAKLIKNAPKINEDPKDALLRKYEEEIKALKEQLSNGGNIGGGEPKKKRRKKKKKVKKIEENGENDENNEENEDGDEDGDEEGDDYNDFALVEDDPEKIKLKEKLAALEKNLLDNKKLDVAENCTGESQAEMDEKIKEQEEENRKFREYREQQLKQSEEMELKLKKLEEEKIKEEESLKNDANKLQKRIKELTTEIEELKLDNGKDRTDYMEGVKAIYRDNQFYREILRYMLSKTELDQIIEMSKYNEEEDKWNVQSFTFQEKSLALPSMKLGQLGGRFGKQNNGNKQIIFQNYGDEDNNNINNSNEDNDNENDDDDNYEENINKDFEDLNRKREYDMKQSKSKSKYRFQQDRGSSDNLINLNDYDDKANSRINFRLSKEKLYVDGKRQARSQAPGDRNLNKKNFSNTANALEMNNINKILMSKKEREKFEQLSNGMNKGYLNPMYESSNKHKKIFLNPLGSNNGNNIEVSFKATVEINNKMPPIIGNKKINMGQIHEDEYD